MKYKLLIKILLVVLLVNNSLASQEITFNQLFVAYQDGRFNEVIKLSRKVKNKNESEELALIYMLAHSYFNIGSYKIALEYFKKILPNSPYKYEVFNNIGACYFYLKDYKNSLIYFKKSIEDNPGYVVGKKNYSLLDTAIKRSVDVKYSEEAKGTQYLEDLEGLDLFSLSSKSINDVNLAWLYYFMGKYVESIHLLKQAIKNDPKYAFAYMSLGYVYDSIFNHKTALKYYKKALELDNEYPDLWNNVGVTYYFLGNEDLAIEHFKKALELNPYFVYPINNLGFVYLHKREVNTAVKYFQKVIDIEDRDPMILSESYAGLSICFFIKNDIQKASEYKKQAIALNGNLYEKVYLTKYLRWDPEMVNIFIEKVH